MSTTIDQRVVEMRFDNRNFESNVQTSLSTLDKLKQKLNLSGASKGLEDVSNAARKTDFSGISSGIDTIHAKFSALQIMGTTALVNITNSAINAGKRITKALTIDPIKTGFQEYETQINAVQTILANTESKGSTLKDVNSALDELNAYADKTIYNFTEMTRNIGTFTAAGVDLDKSVSSIQGIANLAAVSGSTSQQASTAMYQLSQALAAGKVTLMDWNSVVNAGMGGQVFQDALKRTSEVMGTGAEDAIKKFGSFRESLTQGEWLTTDVLTKTLEQFTMAAEEGSEEWKKFKKQLMDDGYTEKQAEDILKMANTATNAATKVKTFTQLWDVLQEAAQSGWTQTWEIIVGDFEEAKGLLTSVSDAITEMLNKFSDSRNKLLQGWKDLGGRTDVIEGFKNIFSGFAGIVKPIGEAFRAIFPPTTAKQLHAFTAGFKELTASFKVSDETADKIKRTFEGLFSVVDFFRKILLVVAKGIGALFTSGVVSGLLDIVLSVTATIGDIFKVINEGFSGKGLSSIFSGISEIISGVLHGLTGFGDELSGIGGAVSDVIGVIVDSFKKGFNWITENVSFKDVMLGLTGGGVFMAAKKLAGMFDSIGGLAEKGLLGIIFGGGGDDDGAGKAVKFKEVLGSLNDSLGAFTSGIKIGSLVAIAGSITILSVALKNLSELNTGDIAKSLVAVGIMFKMLTTSFKSINSALSTFAGKGVIKTGIAMMMMAKSINILADAMKEMSGLSVKEIAKGLVGIAGSMIALTTGLKSLNGVKIKVGTIIAISVLATAIKNMGTSLAEMGKMSWEEISRGLTAMGGALAEFMITLNILDKVGGKKALAGSVALVIAVKSLDEIGAALEKLGYLSWNEIARGLAAMGGALADLSIVSGVLGKLAGFSGILGSIAIVESSKSLANIADALSDLGTMSWDEIGRGLTAMGGALAELALTSGLLGKLAGFSGLLGAGAIVLGVQSLADITDAFKKFEGLSWDSIKMGLAGMGGALAEVGIITGALGKLAGFSGLLGAGAILIAVQGLGDIANALKQFGSMSWDEIGRGLAGMGGALTEIALISGVLGTFAGLGGLLGSAAILIAVQGLGDIADALKKFGEMSWDEIGRGLTAMGAALGELALGGLLNTLSIIGSFSIAKIAEPLGVLADSLKKWSNVTLPDNLAMNLVRLADGIFAFSLDGLGAGAIAKVAEPLGTLADSVKKWTNVTVPENLGASLKTLASGVKSFTFGGLGAGAISEVATPLGALATSVNKWVKVTVPEDLGDKLKALAEGVKKFTFGGLGAGAIADVAEPLGTLSDSVKKWSKTNVPSDLGTKLKSLSDGVKSFTGGWSVAKGIKNTKTIADAAVALSGVKFGTITSGLNDFSKSMSKLGDASGSISGLGKKITNNITKPISDLGPKLKSAGTKIADSLVHGIKSKTSGLKDAGSKLGESISKGIETKKDKIKSASVSGVKTGLSAVRDYRDNFYDAGAYIAQGLANGMKSKNSEIQAAANAMASAAEKATRAKLQINSPSKVFMRIASSIPEGFAKGITKFGDKIKESTYGMADTAMYTATKSIAGLASLLETDINTQPTIRPVLDLSDVKSGAGAINNMLGFGTSIGVSSNLGAISSIMNRRNQNGTNAEVVSAIDKLRKDIGNINNTSYNINGITYDDGSNISSAVETLVRAAVVGRRV